MSGQDDTAGNAAGVGAGVLAGVGQAVSNARSSGVGKAAGRAWIEIDGRTVPLSVDGIAEARKRMTGAPAK
jgi:hypothetical protein